MQRGVSTFPLYTWQHKASITVIDAPRAVERVPQHAAWASVCPIIDVSLRQAQLSDDDDAAAWF